MSIIIQDLRDEFGRGAFSVKNRTSDVLLIAIVRVDESGNPKDGILSCSVANGANFQWVPVPHGEIAGDFAIAITKVGE